VPSGIGERAGVGGDEHALFREQLAVLGQRVEADLVVRERAERGVVERADRLVALAATVGGW
jgi:hypothetical protein